MPSTSSCRARAMALSKLLNNALLTLRICSIGICFMAVLIHLMKDNTVLDTITRGTLVVLLIHLIVTSVETISPFCLGVAEPLPDHLGWSLAVVLLDYVVAFFVMGAGLAGIGVFNARTNAHMCPGQECKISLVFHVGALVGGGLKALSAFCNMAIAAKMNILRQAKYS